MVPIVSSIALFHMANADQLTFDVVFDGNAFGNNAIASGQITIDNSPEFLLTVENASNGNGTFFEDGLGWSFLIPVQNRLI